MIPAAIALSHRYSELTLPVAILAGDGDLIVHKSKHAERLADDLKGATLNVVAGQGHMLHWAVPEQVVAAITDVQARAS